MKTFDIKAYHKKYYQIHGAEIRKKRNKGIRNDRPLRRDEQFYNLTVIGLCENDKNGKICYLCKCKCGNERKVRRSYLLSGRTKSCGCGKTKASSETGKRTIKFAIEAASKFVGDLSGAMWSRILKNAKTRNLEVTLTKTEAWSLYEKQSKKCALTGIDLYLNPHHSERSRVTASLDRIDSTKGYTIDNVQWVHKDVNLMKNGFSEQRFKEICRLITQHDTKSVT
jgi:hypothetical protein